MKWGHDQLQEDLAAHLRGNSDRVVWTNMQLGPQGSPRPDVYTIPKSFSRFTPLAYEIKISMADFRRDVTSGKWQSYLQFAAGVIFAVPAGLIKKEDVPPGCGLIVRHDEVWRTVKGPTLKATDNLPRDAWLKLMIDGLDRQAGREPKPRPSGAWVAEQAVRKKFGDQLGIAVRDLATAEMYFKSETLKTQRSTEELRTAEAERIAHARQHAEQELNQIKYSQGELCKVLGLAPDAKLWDIKRAAQVAAERLNGDEEVRRLRNHLQAVQRALTQALEPMPAITQAKTAGDDVEAA